MSAPPLSVLIVDDDKMTATLLRGLLKNIGADLLCETVWAATGVAAREEFKRGSYQLVLLDYLLPDDNGLSLLDAINELPTEPRPIVIMLTGGGSEEVAVEAMKRGAKDYMVKTAMNLPALRRAIIGALERTRLEERLAESTAELRRQNEQLEADLTMAREVQQALLPQQYPVFPAGVAPGHSRLHFAHRWMPSHKVAGDFFMVFPISDTRVGVFLCDVMGHGVRAALITALLRGLLSEQKTLVDTPGPFLDELNRELKALLERIGELVFVTAIYLVVDTATSELYLANAGHPAPLVLQAQAGQVAFCHASDGPGPALGLMPEFTYETTHHPLTAGDRLLVFTDGVFEVENSAGEEFGQSRLHDAIQARLAQATPQLLDGLLADVKSFRPETEAATMPDDVTLVMIDYGRSPTA